MPTFSLMSANVTYATGDASADAGARKSDVANEEET